MAGNSIASVVPLLRLGESKLFSGDETTISGPETQGSGLTFTQRSPKSDAISSAYTTENRWVLTSLLLLLDGFDYHPRAQGSTDHDVGFEMIPMWSRPSSWDVAWVKTQ